MALDATALPSELLVAPQPLIGFYGLDIVKSSVHKTIWDAFNNNRKSDRGSVQFKILTPNYEFPVSKPKRASYEWYHPKGILKRNWMLKHLHVLPAVVVLFQDLEWNDPQWSEKQLQCASHIQSLKHSLQGRNTRLALVLVQKTAPLPASEDFFASERAASLTNACTISAKMLFILPHSDHLMGYTVRLESAFLEMAQSYYSQMSKRVRMHRDQLTSAHQTLRIRHQFKLGFIAEMRLDFSTALKHFTQAYSNLDDIQIKNVNCLEIKTVGGFLNYKICRLMFKLKIPRDSINHFMNHVDKYKSHVGYKELLFEHYAWLSAQHSAFAELFCEAIKCGLPALQTQHPGIYFHKAAEYIGKRKEAFLQCCSLSLSPTEPLTPNSISKQSTFFSDFYGIRTVKTGEVVSEQQIISLVQDIEKFFNHSAVIITLLGQAMAQFKFYKCLRFRKKLAIDMAEEYFKCGDHAKALTLYSLMLPDYRQDIWSTIFTEVLLKTLRCAFLSASVADFMSCSIESLSPKIKCDQKERIIVLENLWKVFQNVPPVSQSQIAPELRTSWESSLSAFNSPITVELDKLSELIECIVSFDKAQVKNDETVGVKLFIRSKTDVPLRIRNFSIVLSEGTVHFKLKAINSYTFNNLDELKQSELDGKEFPFTKLDSDFRLEPEKCYKIVFDSESQQFLENIELQALRVELEMGTDRHFMVLTKLANSDGRPFKNYNRFKDLIDNLNYNATCYIVPTFHLTTQNNQMQLMLVNEYFKVMCNITNTFNVFLQNVGISITVPSNLRNTVFLATDLTQGRQKLLSQIQIDIGELQMQGSSKISYYVFSLSEANIELQQKVWYHLETTRPRLNSEHALNEEAISLINKNEKFPRRISSNIKIEVDNGNRLKKIKDDFIVFSCVPEFKFSGRFYTLNRQPSLKAYRGENFLFRANIEVQTPCCIDILETYFVCDHNLNQSPYSFKRKKHSTMYKCGDTLEDLILLRSNSSTSDWVTQKTFESSQQAVALFSRSKRAAKRDTKPLSIKADNANAGNLMNRNLISKFPINTTIIGNTSLAASQMSSLNTSIISDDGKLPAEDDLYKDDVHANIQPTKTISKVIYNRAIDALQATGHCRGFIKGISIYDSASNSLPQFGVYCVKWRRTGCKDENESKFIISGIEVDEPLMNIYCSIEDKMFVKIPMTLKIVLKNTTAKVIHLIATLSNTDSFMCSGHKQLNISIFSQSEQEIIYNLHPLKVGWQNLPELTLEYNTQLDPDRDELQQSLLCQLVQRSMPKKVFILPPPKQRLGLHK